LTIANTLETRCSVCLRSKVDILTEESGKSFQDHITYVHDFWSYCSYLIYLSEKGKEDMNGLEGKIRDLIDQANNSWIPTSNTELEEAASRKKLEEAQQTAKETIEKISTTSEAVQKAVTEMQEKLKTMQEEMGKLATKEPETMKADMESLKQKMESVLEAVTKK
jgi:chromosome segregation ATPase